jgi:putative transposase
VKFGFIAKHRGVWPADWLCEALGVSRGGFYAWLTRPRSQRSRSDEELGAKVRSSFLASDRTYGARRIWHDMLAEGVSCGLHRIERLMRLQALKARPRRRRLPPDLGERQAAAIAPNVLDRSFEAPALIALVESRKIAKEKSENSDAMRTLLRPAQGCC